jgi:protoheme IX farnesyltransferase
LTVTHGRKSTRTHILVYTVLLIPFAIGAAFTSIGGPVYLATAVVLNAEFLRGAWRIWRRPEAVAEADNYKVEKYVFRFSLLYLFLHFTAFLVEAALKPYGLGGW